MIQGMIINIVANRVYVTCRIDKKNSGQIQLRRERYIKRLRSEEYKRAIVSSLASSSQKWGLVVSGVSVMATPRWLLI